MTSLPKKLFRTMKFHRTMVFRSQSVDFVTFALDTILPDNLHIIS